MVGFSRIMRAVDAFSNKHIDPFVKEHIEPRINKAAELATPFFNKIEKRARPVITNIGNSRVIKMTKPAIERFRAIKGEDVKNSARKAINTVVDFSKKGFVGIKKWYSSAQKFLENSPAVQTIKTRVSKMVSAAAAGTAEKAVRVFSDKQLQEEMKRRGLAVKGNSTLPAAKTSGAPKRAEGMGDLFAAIRARGDQGEASKSTSPVVNPSVERPVVKAPPRKPQGGMDDIFAAIGGGGIKLRDSKEANAKRDAASKAKEAEKSEVTSPKRKKKARAAHQGSLLAAIGKSSLFKRAQAKNISGLSEEEKKGITDRRRSLKQDDSDGEESDWDCDL
jgi:hypothetical protein